MTNLLERIGIIVILIVSTVFTPMYAIAISPVDRKAVIHDTVFYQDDVETDSGSILPGVDPANVDFNENVEIAQRLAENRGWHEGPQFDCLFELWMRESSWNQFAINDAEGNNDLNDNSRLDSGETISETERDAYGIPQSLPGGKMASHGDDWRHNPETQIRWGLDYIDGRYETPCNAIIHHNVNNWY